MSLNSLLARFTRKDMSTYEMRFERALRLTQRWGLIPAEFKSVDRRYENPENLNIFNSVVSKYLSHFQAEQISQQCFAINLALKAPLEKAMGIPLTFTLGYVSIDKHRMFYTDSKQLKSLLRTGASSHILNLHAWLTLPSHEIIDITLGTTYGVVTNTRECIGKMCFLHPDKMSVNMRYYPQLIGESYLNKIGFCRPLLFF